jgi:thioesterase domain-containing protein
MNKFEIESFLNEQIPISRAMDLSVIIVNDEVAILKASLETNKNHLGTAFGGSLQSLLIFSAYTWLFHFLHEICECHVLIKNSHTEYLLPVREDIVATCRKPDEQLIEEFMKTYERRGKARIELEASIATVDGVSCQFRGQFVAEKGEKSVLG